jgi:hypothetical protein
MSNSVNLSSGMLAYSSQNESMLILAQPANSNETTNDFNTRLENAVVKVLGSGINHETINSTSYNLTVTQLPESDREIMDVETPIDISDTSFALFTNYEQTVQPTPESNSYNIGINELDIVKNFSIIKPTNSIYDSHIKITSDDNNVSFFSTSDNNNTTAYPTDISGTIPNKGSWEATFDYNNQNVNYSRAINSEYNTLNYERPMRVDEHTYFNKNYSLGMDLLSQDNIQHYFTLHPITGEPLASNIPNTGVQSSPGNAYSESFRLVDNGMYAEKTINFNNISSEHYGSYRVQQFPDMAIITSDGSTNNLNAVTAKIPFFNANINATLPSTQLSIGQFYTMFNQNSENILPHYKYTITVSETENSGYSPNPDMIGRTDNYNTFTLDDSSLLNNSKYMENYVNGQHTLSFTPATLSIVPDFSASSNNLASFSLNNQRETLDEFVFDNGSIKINNYSPTTRHRTDDSSTLNITPNVFYGSENNKPGISDELKQNYLVSYLAQLVAKNSKDIVGSFMKNSENSTVAFDLYNGNICNSFFNANNFDFKAPNKNTNYDAEIFRINPSKQLCSINGLCSLKTGTAEKVKFVSIYASVQNLATMITTDNVFNTATMRLNLRNLTDSSIYSTAINNGWNISIPSDYHGKMVSSSTSAYAADNTCFPSLQETKNLISGGNNIDYTISVNTDTSGHSANISESSKLLDYINIDWSVRGTNKTNSLIISEEMLTKTQTNVNVTQTEITTPINTFGRLQGKQVNTYLVISERTINYSFILPLRIFEGLTMTTPNITVRTTYYIVKDKITNETYPSSYLQYISDSLNTNYTLVSEIFSNVSPNNGTFSSTDFCDMIGKVQGKDINSNNIIDLTNQKEVSTMYGIPVTMELKSIAEQVSNINGDVILSIEAEYLSNGEEGNVLHDSVNSGYIVQLTNRYDISYTVDYWNSSISNITQTTNISTVSDTTDYSNKSLTINNGYDIINTWNTTDYYINITYEQNDKSVCVLNICKVNTTTPLYEIRTNNFSFLNTQAFITNIPKDIYRFNKWIGQKQSNSAITFSERFSAVDYTYNKNLVNEDNVLELDTGVYLTKPTLNSITFKQISDIGKFIKFSLKGDLIGVNMVGNVDILNENVYISNDDTTTIANHIISNYGFTFQYINGDNVSRILTIDRYRGFDGVNSTNLNYIIQRDTMVATLNINRSTSNNSFPDTISQSFNVYNGKQYSVNSLSGSIGDIGLQISFLNSMLTPQDIKSFTIYTLGDNVSFDIKNPSSVVYRQPPNSTTLKTYILDTFTGSNFNDTNKPLSINSYRLKIKTTNSSNLCDKSVLDWTIALETRVVAIYHNSNYLGNPSVLSINDPYQDPNTTVWTEISNITSFNDIVENGLNIGPWTIKRRNTSQNSNYVPSISYFVIHPPYYIFRQVFSDTKTLPYEFSETDLQESYQAVADIVEGQTIYNPFKSLATYNYTDNSSVTITFDQSMINDVTFVNNSPEPLISSYSSAERNIGTQYFVVEGNHVKIVLYIGLKTQNGYAVETIFADSDDNSLPLNRLMYINSIKSYFFEDSLVNNNSGIIMKLLQPLNTNTPYSTLSTAQVFSSEEINNANITISIENFFIFKENTPMLQLNLPAGQGTKVSLLTHETITNTDGSIDIYVYKYKAINNVDYNDVNNDGSPYSYNSLESVELTFLERQYKMISISSSQYATLFTNLELARPENGFKINQLHDEIIASQSYKFANLPWIQDTNWPEPILPTKQENASYTNLHFYTNTARSTLPPKIFSTRTDGKAKVFMIFKYPLLTFFDKIGRSQFKVTGWGTTINRAVDTLGLYIK